LTNQSTLYALLGENTFYSMNAKGVSIEEILEYSKLTKQRIEGTLFWINVIRRKLWAKNIIF